MESTDPDLRESPKCPLGPLSTPTYRIGLVAKAAGAANIAARTAFKAAGAAIIVVLAGIAA